jgi:hypothetical protein
MHDLSCLLNSNNSMEVRMIKLAAAMCFLMTACSGTVEFVDSDGEAGGAATTSDGGSDKGAGGSPDTGDGGNGGQFVGDPMLVFEFEGPAAQTWNMGETADLFCFSLEAQRASMDVALPLLHIDGVDGGRVLTHSLLGTVFEWPSVYEGEANVIGPVKISVSDENRSASLETLQKTLLHLEEGEVRHFCVRSNIVAWSATPEDFFGKTYQVVMEEWKPESVTITETGAALSTEQIIAPLRVIGESITISSLDGIPPKKYTGTLSVKAAAAMPPGRSVVPGESSVGMLAFSLSADGDGACLKRVDVTRHGTGSSEDIERVSLYADVSSDPEGYVYMASLYDDNIAHLGFFSPGLLFCLEGGEERSFVVEASFRPSAQIGSEHALAIDDVLRDVVWPGSVGGDPSVSGNTFIVTSP